MNQKLNTYKNCKSPKVVGSLPFNGLIEEIKTGRNFGKLVQKVRAIGKGNQGFDELKESAIPTYTANATFNGYRGIKNIIAPTGLLYVDLDGSTELNMTVPIIFAAYKSVSGLGITVIIRVENLTAENIKPCYTGVSEQLGVKLDQSCAEMARQTVFSYDPDLVFNPNSTIVDANYFNPKGYISPLLKNRERGRSDYMYPYSYSVDTKSLVWNENNTFDVDGKDYLLFDEKVPTVDVYIPQIIPLGKRHMIISIIINNLCYLNPYLIDRRIRGLIQIVNSRCIEPLGKSDIEKIFREVKTKIQSGTLEGIPTRFRKIIFSPDCPREVRVKMTAAASGLVRSGKTLLKIVQALDDWDLFQGKITNIKLAKSAGVHLNTIKKYLKLYSELKEQKDYINQQI